MRWNNIVQPQRGGRQLAFKAVHHHSRDLSRFGLVEADLRRRLFVVGTDGDLRSGIDAVLAIWWTLPGYRWLAGLVSITGIYQSSALLYDLVYVPLLTWWNEGRHLRRLYQDGIGRDGTKL